ncbi:MAG: hypothetical protein FWF01_04165, partial [Alphaproteobacteria bacterium]|nr:hypothetical protein [Alphaproteobacteria bacterium]
QAQAEYPGAINLFPLVKLALEKWNTHVIRADKPAEEMAFFQFDPETKSCFLNGDMALKAFNWYNSARKDPRLPNIPGSPADVARLAIAIHNAHGYTGNIMHRQPIQKDNAPPATDLLQRDCEPAQCGQLATVALNTWNRNMLNSKARPRDFVRQRV